MPGLTNLPVLKAWAAHSNWHQKTEGESVTNQQCNHTITYSDKNESHEPLGSAIVNQRLTRILEVQHRKVDDEIGHEYALGFLHWW